LEKAASYLRLKSSWIQTFTGKAFYPLDPRPEDVCIEDIAHSLAAQCRFAGHVKCFYSVASHAIFVSEICAPDNALWGLLHDASEAYLIDLPSPLKQSNGFEAYRKFEETVTHTICEKFALPLTIPPDVKHADLVALATEARDLMAPPPRPWDTMPSPSERRIVPLSPQQAEQAFLERFWQLRKGQRFA
jgi:hypothetical protein